MSEKPKSSMVYWVGAAVVLGLLMFFTSWPRHHVGPPDPNHRPNYAKGELTIAHADGAKTPFHVEIARTTDEHQYGLMFVKDMPHDQGMIFMQPGDYEAMFWMKNTLIPLDMLFVHKDGVIVKIVANAKPLDLSIIRSDEPVRAIIELNGGEAARDNIKEGDKVLFPGLGDAGTTP